MKVKKISGIFEAMQLTEDADYTEVAAWCGGEVIHTYIIGTEKPITNLSTLLANKMRIVPVSWWIIRDETKVIDVCMDTEFKDRYEPVTE